MKLNALRVLAGVLAAVLLAAGAVLAARNGAGAAAGAEAGGAAVDLLPALLVLTAGALGVAGLVMWRRRRRVLVQLSTAMAAMLAGGLTAEALMRTGDTPPREPRVVTGPAVEVVRAELADVAVRVEGQGTVRAKSRGQVVPQVSGRIVELHPQMASGGFIRAGEVLMRIDPSDYDLGLREARTALARAEAEYSTAIARIGEAEARAADSRTDLERLRELAEQGAATAREVEKASVAHRVDAAQVEVARAAQETAQAGRLAAQVAVEQAEVNLSRTSITLPFDAVIASEQVDIGQHVTAGQAIAEVYGTAAVEVAVPLEDRELRWIESLPLGGAWARRDGGVVEPDVVGATPEESGSEVGDQGQEGRGTGGDAQPRVPTGVGMPQGGGDGRGRDLPVAEVSARFAGAECTWFGRAVRAEAELDARTRMVRVVVEVADPWDTAAGQPPLMPGMFVRVAIHGRTLRGVAALPRYAVHSGDEVWVVEDGRLRVRPVEVARRDREWAYVSAGLGQGDAVIVSPMDVVAEGMLVRIAGEQPGGPGAFAEEVEGLDGAEGGDAAGQAAESGGAGGV